MVMSRLICICNKVSEKEIRKLLKKSPLATVGDVARVSRASTSCGRCYNEMKNFIEQYQKKDSGQLIIPFQ